MTAPARNPALAPVYAFGIAFALVFILGQWLGPPPPPDLPRTPPPEVPKALTVRVALLDEAPSSEVTVGLRPAEKPETRWDRVELAADGTLMPGTEQKIEGMLVCVDVPEGFTVKEASRQIEGQGLQELARGPSTCTTEPITGRPGAAVTALTIVRPVVRIDGERAELGEEFKVQVGSSGRSPVELEPKADADDVYVRDAPTLGERICLVGLPAERQIDTVTTLPGQTPVELAANSTCIETPAGPLHPAEIVFTLKVA